jgi:cytochrome oxidase Cu insertion factor (SCO1/SenC/PrrC family)
MLFIFIFPVVASWFLFHYHTYFNLKTLNQGTLIASPVDVKYLYSDSTSATQKIWRVIYVADKNCDSQCQQIHHQLEQVRKALGKDRDRVTLIFMNSDNAKLQKQNFVTNNKIYLVDPLNNLFMYYPSNVDPLYVLKDLKRVLEVSQIG